MLEPNLVAQANTSVSIYEQLQRAVDSLESIQAATSDAQTQTELNLITTKLKSLLILFDDEELLPALAGQLAIKTVQSKIERLGLSKEVIRLSTQSKLNVTQIAEHFSTQGIAIETATLTRFLKAYEASSYAEKIRSQSESIFDTSNQLERLLTIINTQISRLNYSVDAKQQENHKGYVSELRQTIKLAADLQRSVQAQMEQTKFQQDVKYIILSVCTAEQRAVVLERLRAYSSSPFEVVPSYAELPYACSSEL